MVFSGCLSIVSSVVVAYCHHKQPSADIPPSLNKLITQFTKIKKRLVKTGSNVAKKQVMYNTIKM